VQLVSFLTNLTYDANFFSVPTTANLARKSGPLPSPTILERVDQNEYDPAAEVEVRAARKAIIKARIQPIPILLNLCSCTFILIE
jgi:hypothetical protein